MFLLVGQVEIIKFNLVGFPIFLTENLSKLVGLYSADTSFQINLGNKSRFLKLENLPMDKLILDQTRIFVSSYLKKRSTDFINCCIILYKIIVLILGLYFRILINRAGEPANFFSAPAPAPAPDFFFKRLTKVYWLNNGTIYSLLAVFMLVK